MNALIPIALAEMSVAQIAALPPAELLDAHHKLNALQAALKTLLERTHAAMLLRYAETEQAARIQQGKDFGICHLHDGGLQVSIDLPKRVSWDQAQLRALAARISAAGDRVEDYLDLEYTIPEARYKAWPAALQAQFSPARTVKPGKAVFKLSWDEEELS